MVLRQQVVGGSGTAFYPVAQHGQEMRLVRAAVVQAGAGGQPRFGQYQRLGSQIPQPQPLEL